MSVGKAKRRVIDMPTFNCTLDQRALPLGFSVQKMPDEDLICDFQGCDKAGRETIVLTCGHSFHLRCINSNSCIYCQPFLLKTIKDLSQKFNATLLTSEMEEEREEPSGTNENEDEDIFESGFDDDDYYSSHEFVDHLMIELDSISMSGAKPRFHSAKHRGLFTIVTATVKDMKCSGGTVITSTEDIM